LQEAGLTIKRSV